MLRRSLVRGFYSGMDKEKEKLLRECSMGLRMPRGRDEPTLSFESRISVVKESKLLEAPTPNPVDESEKPKTPPSIVQVCPVRLGSPEAQKFYHLRKGADTWRVKAPTEQLVYVVEPDLTQFPMPDEAQVELITAYRNILLDAVHGFRPFSELRVPPLSVHPDLSGKHVKRIIKMNQQALIKSFHRIPEYMQDELNDMGAFVHVVVPDAYYELFARIYAEEPWQVARTLFNLGRTDMYTDTEIPAQLREYPGWTGKRPELLGDQPIATLCSSELPPTTEIPKLNE
eukprot:PhF_6_TR40011/c0_g1_i1/m.59379